MQVVQTFIAYCYPHFDGEVLKQQEVIDLVDLYIFADKYRCQHSLKNLVMDSIQDKMLANDTIFVDQMVKHIFSNTTSDHEAPIRQYAVAVITFVLQTSYDDSQVDLLHQALLDVSDLQLACLQYQRQVFWKATGQCKCWGVPEDITSDPRKRHDAVNRPFGACYFHAHDTGATCFATKENAALCPKHGCHPATGSDAI